MSNLVRVVRQFLVAPKIAEQLGADFLLPMPTMGAYLTLAHVRRPLRVVSVVFRPRAHGDESTSPTVVAFTEYEPAAASLEAARAHGWQPVPGLPQPREWPSPS